MKNSLWTSLLFWIMCYLKTASSILPTCQITIGSKNPDDTTFVVYCSPSTDSFWGGELVSDSISKWLPIVYSVSDPEGCNISSIANDIRNHSSFYLLVDRGSCSFYQKALNAQRLQAKGVIIRNTAKAIYENDLTEIRSQDNLTSFAYNCHDGEGYLSSLVSPPWDTQNNDPSCSFNSNCPSHRCLPTTQYHQEQGHQVCCMWDQVQMMGANLTLAKSIHIPTVFVSVHGGTSIGILPSGTTYASISTRPRPFIDPSNLVIWFLGVATVIGASYYSASAERREAQGLTYIYAFDEAEEKTLEMNWYHAVGFIVVASSFLILFYYIKAAAFLSILFALGSLQTVTTIFMEPLIAKLLPRTKSFSVACFNCGSLKLSEVMGFLISLFLVTIWLFHRRRPYFWILQDLFSICLCFSFLKSIRLPNLKIGTILLSLAFFYDIFFVFLSPLVFGSSVMVDVAKGGAGPETKPDYPGVDYCDRYPKDHRCLQPESIPMLISFPQIFDYQGGSSMLGLGDIVLPGLLLSFALRYDYLKRKTRSNGYFTYLGCGYAAGLMLATIAVHLMQMGQPALLYLVPSTLGLFLILAKRNGDFNELWMGPQFVVPNEVQKSEHQSLATEENETH